MTADHLFYQQFSLLTDEQKAAVLLVIQTFLGKDSLTSRLKSKLSPTAGGATVV